MLGNKKFWQHALIIELIATIFIEFINIIVGLVHRNMHGTTIITGILSIIICLIILWNMKTIPNKKSKITQWLGIICLPFIFEVVWLIIFGFLTNLTANIKWLEFIIFVFGIAIYLVMWLPIVELFISKIKNPVAKFIPWMILVEVAGGLSAWHVKNQPGLTYLTTSNLIGAIAFFIAACYITYCWNYRLNPNLKFKISPNWSYLVLTILVLYMIWDIIWNISSGELSRFGNTTFLQSSFYFNWKQFYKAISTGISEETFRYLSIVVLLEYFQNTKRQIVKVIIGSAIIFGAFHLLNVMNEPLSVAIAQMIIAIMGGLIWAILYLYTGKLWVTMIIHGLYDYLTFLQPAGISTSEAVFVIYCVDEVVIPILLTIWMLTGKRKEVLQENAKRLMAKQNFSF